MNSALSLCWPLFCLFCLFVSLFVCWPLLWNINSGWTLHWAFFGLSSGVYTLFKLVLKYQFFLNLFWYIDSFVDLCRTLQWAFIGLSGGVSTLLSTLVDKIEKWACSMVHKYDFSKSYESLFCRGNQYSGCRKFDADVVLTLKDAPQSEFNVIWILFVL